MRIQTVMLVAIGLVCSQVGRAQTSRELAEKHPAAQVVVKFLRLSVNRDYAQAADLIAPASLATLKADYVKKVKNPRTAMDEASAMCRAVGAENETAVEAMTPVSFYTAYNQGMQRRYNVTDEVNQRIADSLELNILSVADEGATLAHFLVRTQHQTMSNQVSHLEVISLQRQGSQWLVSLGEKEPKYSPLGGVVPAAVPPAKTGLKPQAPPAVPSGKPSDAPARKPAAVATPVPRAQ
jgi:hypothetical protein